jgi:hypothetical protein
MVSQRILWRTTELTEPHIHVCTDSEIARVLVNSSSSLTNARVRDKLNAGVGGSMFEDLQHPFSNQWTLYGIELNSEQ